MSKSMVFRWNLSSGSIVELSFPDDMTLTDLEDFRDHMKITFRMIEARINRGTKNAGQQT